MQMRYNSGVQVTLPCTRSRNSWNLTECQSGKQESAKNYRNKNKNQQQIQGIGHRGNEKQLYLWEASALNTALALRPCIDFKGKFEIKFSVQYCAICSDQIVFFYTEQNKNIESLLLEMNKQLAEVKDVQKENKTKSKSKKIFSHEPSQEVSLPIFK